MSEFNLSEKICGSIAQIGFHNNISIPVREELRIEINKNMKEFIRRVRVLTYKKYIPDIEKHMEFCFDLDKLSGFENV